MPHFFVEFEFSGTFLLLNSAHTHRVTDTDIDSKMSCILNLSI